MRRIILGFIFAFIFIVLNGYPYENKYSFNSNMGVSGLIDLSKIDMSHSMSFSVGANSIGKGFYQSAYTNHIVYNFSNKVTFKANLNFVNFGTTNFKKSWDIESNNDNRTRIYPDLQLEFKPTDTMKIKIEFSSSGRNFYNDWRDD